MPPIFLGFSSNRDGKPIGGANRAAQAEADQDVEGPDDFLSWLLFDLNPVRNYWLIFL
jgi:hypothetical protein